MNRVIAKIGTVMTLCLAIGASQASAQTVYDYVYSGTYFDGSGAGSPFSTRIGGLEYDRANQRFYVAENHNPGGRIARLTPAGVGVPFAATGTPRVEIAAKNLFVDPQVTVDQTGGPHAGNFYAGASERKYGWDSGGAPIPGWEGELLQSGQGIAVLPNGDVLTDGSSDYPFGDGKNAVYDAQGEVVSNDWAGSMGLKPSEKKKWAERASLRNFAVDPDGDVWGVKYSSSSMPGQGKLMKMDESGRHELFEVNQFEALGQRTRGVAIDHANGDVFAVRENNTFEQYDNEGRLLGQGWGGPDLPAYEGLSGQPIGIAVDPVTHDVWIANRRSYGGVAHVEKFERVNARTVPTVTAIKPGYTDPKFKTIQLRGIVNPDGLATTDCYFVYGLNQNLGTTGTVEACDQGTVFEGSADQQVTATISVKHGVRYWYRVYSKNANGQLSVSNPKHFIPQYKPTLHSAIVDRINTDGVRFTAGFNTNGGNTSVHFEWGTGGNFQFATPESDTVGIRTFVQSVGCGFGCGFVDIYEPGDYKISQEPIGLSPGTTYEFRAVVTNEADSVYSKPQEFTTYLPDPGSDPCANSQARQQTEASLLPDCRAYELVSARNSGGYDVESDLVPGQAPLEARPDAGDSLLYSIHSGLIPGMSGSPTNLGPDPYVATRGPEAWTTRYVGLPSDGMADGGSFGSPLLGSDASLETFALGGPTICDPCYDDGSTNIPLRRVTGSLEKGMAGTANPPADPAGEVRKPVSADGNHLVFGSEEKFEPAGNEGSVSIYDRNLSTSATQVVSTMPDGSTMPGDAAELDVSADGSRILIGRNVGSDPAGNDLYDLYMHVGTSPNSVEIVDTVGGVSFSGMNSDGAVVYFTTMEHLDGDTDSSLDLFRAEVGATTADVTRISAGTAGTGNTDECEPGGTPNSWNSPSGDGNCNIVAFGGGTGVASGDGTVFFVSPEKLDGVSGSQDQANLYIARPGSGLEFVGVLDTSVGKAPPPPPLHPVATPSFGGELMAPNALAVDQSNGDVYVATTGDSKVQRFTAAGAPKEFSATGSNAISGLQWPIFGAAQIAIDNSGGPNDGLIYVASQNEFFQGTVSVFSPNGALVTTLTGSGTAGGSLGFACGVAIDQTNGDVYIGDFFGKVWRYSPAASPVVEADYSGGISEGFGSCNVAAADGYVYVVGRETSDLKRFQASDFAMGPPPAPEGLKLATGVRSVATDQAAGQVYAARSTEILILASNEDGTQIQTFGSGSLSNSSAVAVRSTNGHVFASTNGNAVVEFDNLPAPYAPLDHYAVVNGVQDAAAHSYRDFQVSPDGRFAMFATKQALTGFETRGFEEVYRYDAATSALDCVSCATTGAAPDSHTGMPRHGLGLTNDGRVFFNSLESFTLRDTNARLDVYEWVDGRQALISTGIGRDDSGLVTVSSDGVNAFFYTREKLSALDENGNAYRIYVAREGGGYLFEPDAPPCAASDECHGPGSQAPPPPNINTVTGSKKTKGTNRKKCKKGRVLKKGKCVPKRKKNRRAKRGNG